MIDKIDKDKPKRSILDKQISSNMFNTLIDIVVKKLQEEDVTAARIYGTLKKLNCSNTTIARVINYLLPDSNMNANSIGQMAYRLRHKKTRENEFDLMLENLLKEL